MLKIQGKIGTVNFWIIFLIERKSSYFIEYFFKIIKYKILSFLLILLVFCAIFS